MAQQVENANNGGYSAKPNKKQCDAYVNIDFVDSNGVAHRYQAFNPLYEEGSKLQRSLVNKAKASKNGEIEVKGKITIRVATKDDGSDISF